MRLLRIGPRAVILHWFSRGYSALLFMRLLRIGPRAVIVHWFSCCYSALLFMWLLSVGPRAVILHWSSRGYSALLFTWLFCIALHAVILHWSSRDYSALLYTWLFCIALHVIILHCSSFMTGVLCRRTDMQHSLLRHHYLNSILHLQLCRRRSVVDLGTVGKIILKWTSKVLLIWKVTRYYDGLSLVWYQEVLLHQTREIHWVDGRLEAIKRPHHSVCGCHQLPRAVLPACPC
jgi:hypothetical protein